MSDTGHWTLRDGVIITDETFGFLYIITNTTNNRKYIGKKQKLTKLKRKPLKGKKNKRISVVDTDWQTYTGSSNELNADILKLGKEHFTFEIIRACDSKWDLAYHDMEIQMNERVLLREDYYNGCINLRVPKAPKHLWLSASGLPK